MIFVGLKGGLGNQMFQYAAARGAQRPLERIFIDVSALNPPETYDPDFTVRNFGLGIFQKARIALLKGILLNIVKKKRFHGRLGRLFQIVHIWQRGNEFIDLKDRQIISGLYLDGYFQSERYFAHIRHKILKDFTFPILDNANNAILDTIISCENAVSIHVRRGDYAHSNLINSIHGVLPLQYYEEAVTRLQNCFFLTDLFIFSDDMDWCRKHLLISGLRSHFVSLNVGEASWKDMALMQACKHHVIANSSFSWWGAWLANGTGQVFAPDRWFATGNTTFDITLIIPPHWHILHVD